MFWEFVNILFYKNELKNKNGSNNDSEGVRL